MRCTVESCSQSNSRRARNEKPVHFYRFPKDPHLQSLWVQFCKRKTAIKTDAARICSLHFKEDDFEDNLKYELGFSNRSAPRLKPGTVPTVETKRAITKKGTSTVKRNNLETFVSDTEFCLVEVGTFEREPSSVYEEADGNQSIETTDPITIKTEPMVCINEGPYLTPDIIPAVKTEPDLHICKEDITIENEKTAYLDTDFQKGKETLHSIHTERDLPLQSTTEIFNPESTHRKACKRRPLPKEATLQEEVHEILKQQAQILVNQKTLVDTLTALQTQMLSFQAENIKQFSKIEFMLNRLIEQKKQPPEKPTIPIVEEEKPAELENSDEDDKKNPKRSAWPEAKENALIEIWRKRIVDLRTVRKNSQIIEEMVAEMWQMGYSCTPLEVKTKMHNLTSRYRKEKIWILEAGGLPSEWPLYEAVNRLLGNNEDFRVRKQDNNSL